MFIVHYDWSGQYHSSSHIQFDGPVLSLGGYLAPAEKWDEFEERWKEVLDRKNIRVLHITDFSKTTARWTHPEKIEFLDQLAIIIRETITLGTFSTLLLQDYVDILEPNIPTETRSRAHIPWKKKMMPYLFVIYDCLDWMRAAIPPGEKAAIIYEDDERTRHAAYTFTRELIKYYKWEDKFELPPNFRPKGDPHALESADILAYVSRFHHQIFPKSSNVWVESLNIQSLGPLVGKHLTKEYLIAYLNSYNEAQP